MTNTSVVFGAAEFSGYSEDTSLSLTASEVLGRRGIDGRQDTFLCCTGLPIPSLILSVSGVSDS